MSDRWIEAEQCIGPHRRRAGNLFGVNVVAAGRQNRRKRGAIKEFLASADVMSMASNEYSPSSPTMYCLGCLYILDGLPENRCPECGRSFERDDPRTFSTRKRTKTDALVEAWSAAVPARPRRRRRRLTWRELIVRLGLVVLLVLLLMFLSSLGWWHHSTAY